VAKVYRNIAVPILFFGLELTDCLVVFGVFLGVFFVSDRLVPNLVLVSGAFFAIRLLKRGKPSGYTLHLLKFLATPKDRHMELEPLKRRSS